MDLKNLIREIQDFPTSGINFKDVTTLFKEKDAFHYVVMNIADKFRDKKISKILGIESRGFIMGGALAFELNAGFVPVRKKGKLPSEVFSETYRLEYGTDTVEMHSDALSVDDIVLIHDDLLATGGTAEAVLKMVKNAGVQQIYLSFICDLEFIETPQKVELKKYTPHILVKY